MTEEISKVKAELEAVNSQLCPLMERSHKLCAQLRYLESKEFVAVNQIRKSDVELSTGPDVEWFGTIWDFAKHLNAKPTRRRWAEWNTRIYHTSDLIAGRMPETPGLIEHVTE